VFVDVRKAQLASHFHLRVGMPHGALCHPIFSDWLAWSCMDTRGRASGGVAGFL